MIVLSARSRKKSRTRCMEDSLADQNSAHRKGARGGKARKFGQSSQRTRRIRARIGLNKSPLTNMAEKLFSIAPGPSPLALPARMTEGTRKKAKTNCGRALTRNWAEPACTRTPSKSPTTNWKGCAMDVAAPGQAIGRLLANRA